MLVQRLEGLFRWHRVVMAVLILAVIAFGLVGNQLSAFFSRPCAERPAYPAGIVPEHRAMLDTLFDKGLLYCVTPPADLAAVQAKIYWGADGMNAVLYFPVSSMDGLSVRKYDYRGSAGSNLLFVNPAGDAPVGDFVPDIVSRAMTNEAPDGSGYFFRVDGAPRPNDRGVHLELYGPARQDKGVANRDFFRDLNLLSKKIEGAVDASKPNVLVTVEFIVYPPRWDPVVRRRVDPRLADADGKPDLKALRSIDNLSEPSIFQSVSGPFGNTLWVIGTISTSQPALVLVDADQTIRPKSDMGWEAARGNLRLHHFAFDVLPSQKAYEARYWIDRRQQSSRPPDKTWSVTFP